MANTNGTGQDGSENRRRNLSDPFASGRKKRQPRPTVPPPQAAPPPPPPAPPTRPTAPAAPAAGGGLGAPEPPAPPTPPTPPTPPAAQETAPPAKEENTVVNNDESTSPTEPDDTTPEEVTPEDAAPAAEEDEEIVEVVPGDVQDVDAPDTEPLSDEDIALLQDAERDLVAEYRDRAARAEAELANFRRRVERDRQANREAVIAEIIRTLLPAVDDLDRAEQHGDLAEGTPFAIVAQKVRTAIEKHGVRRVGEVGEPFDPNLHEALMQQPSSKVTVETVAAVIEVGYQLGDRLIRPAKVAVEVPEQ